MEVIFHNAIKFCLQFPSDVTRCFRGFGSGFTELHAKLDADTLLCFAIHRRQNETQSQKSTYIKQSCIRNTMSHGKLMQ
jgi:hypothetical protein